MLSKKVLDDICCQMQTDGMENGNDTKTFGRRNGRRQKNPIQFLKFLFVTRRWRGRVKQRLCNINNDTSAVDLYLYFFVNPVLWEQSTALCAKHRTHVQTGISSAHIFGRIIAVFCKIWTQFHHFLSHNVSSSASLQRGQFCEVCGDQFQKDKDNSKQ